MEPLSEMSGFIASILVLLTFVTKDMRLRTTAIFSKSALIIFGAWLPPVLVHLILLALNIARLSELAGAHDHGRGHA
jgi:hypothetical protein